MKVNNRGQLLYQKRLLIYKYFKRNLLINQNQCFMKKNVFLTLLKLHLGCRLLWSISILPLLALFIITSCTKQEAELQDDLTVFKDITFHNGRLIFKDSETFMDYQKWLSENQNNPQLLAERNKALGLKSMTEYYLEGIKLEEDDPKFSDYVSKYPSVFYKEIYDNSTLYVLPHSIILCYVANKDGIFQVGDQIYRIIQNYIYRTGDESKIEMLFLPKDQITTEDVNISLTRHEPGTKSDLGQRTEYFDNDGRFRIVSSLIEHTITDPYLGTGWWYDIRTNPQKKTLFVWATAQLNTKSANGDGYWYFPNDGVQHQIYPDSEEATGVTQHNILVCGGSPVNLNASYCPAYSRGRLYDGYTQWIYIKWNDALSNSPTYTTTKTTYLSDPY